MRSLVLGLLCALVLGCGVLPGGGDGGSGGGSGGSGGSGGGTGGGSGGSGGTGGGSGGGGGAGGSGGGAQDAGPDPLVVDRPYGLTVPQGYDAGFDVPLVVLLHGYTATAAGQDAYFHLSDLARQRTFLLALPDGTIDQYGQHFWNATDACCGFGEQVNDVAYLTAVVEDVKKRFRVDLKRIYFVGHSNGGFMSHRMACDRATMIAAIVSLAGANWYDASKCVPASPVATLEVHGTADTTILYDGGVNGTIPYPGAKETEAIWAARDGCTSSGLSSAGADLDLVTTLFGAETLREQYTGCVAGGAAEVWTMRGAGHVPVFDTTWAPAIYDWLLAHPKP